MRYYLLAIFFAAFHQYLSAQQELFIPRNIARSYAKGTRSKSGQPGEKYWQNSADYTISVDFNPQTLQLNGKETILYYNNSPDTLKEIVFKLYPNLYTKGGVRLTKVSAEDTHDGMTIEQLTVNGNKISNYFIEGTNMFLKTSPIAPHSTSEFTLQFNYFLNKGSHNRTGMIDPQSAFIAYFFPRIAVYDDIDGWNRIPYLGTQEFYNDFCNFKVNVSVPANFIVWATGNLKNCNEVLNEKYCSRLQQAETTDNPVAIIDTADLKMGTVTNKQPVNTWKFEATNISDFTFAVSNHYVWHAQSIMVDSLSKRRTRCDAVYNPEHPDYYDVLKFNYETVKAMSFNFPKWPFPYPHITIFDGLDQMEYPMMVNDNPLERFDAITTTDHEVFHTMFPFYMGINETKYGWMDEGWATIGEWLISPMIDSTIRDDYGMQRYNYLSGNEEDLPITTLSTQLNGNSFFLNSYVKPALGYLYVKDLLGDELFTKALHYYISNWHDKHPMPLDFFNCFNTASGKNLNWFWNKWFYETGYADLKIAAVQKRGKKYTIIIENKGSKPVPVDIEITFKNDRKINMHQSIEAWKNGEKSIELNFKSKNVINKIVLGSLYTPDIDKSDNEWINTTK